MKKSYYILIVLTLFGCHQSSNDISAKAKEYIGEVIQILRHNSINKSKINWGKFEKDIYTKAKGAQSIPQTYHAIELAIILLEDNHSYFKPVTKKLNLENQKSLPIFNDTKVPKDIGYIRIPFCIGDEDENKKYINRILTKIENQNNKTIKGWIIDLRNNFGRNMWPMLISLEPILGNGIVGYFKDSNSRYSSWELKEGKVYLDNEIILESPKFIKLKDSSPIVAVLTNSETASSGEAISVAFKGRSNTKSFGGNTYGVSTGCKSYSFSDGSIVNLATSLFSDRNKIDYGFQIKPDFECNENEIIETSSNWIYEQYKITTANKVQNVNSR